MSLPSYKLVADKLVGCSAKLLVSNLLFTLFSFAVFLPAQLASFNMAALNLVSWTRNKAGPKPEGPFLVTCGEIFRKVK